MSSTRPDAAPVLVADIGGTNARAAIVTRPGSAPDPVFKRRTRDFDGLAEFLASALEELGGGHRPRSALCAVASPVDRDPIELTNAGWRFSRAGTADALGLDRVEFVNDWVAQGWATTQIGDDHLQTIHPGRPDPMAPRLALGPGTGLGSALVTPGSTDWQVFATEGGHISFAPRTAREWALVERIQARFGHCSAERLASGIGIETVYAALHDIDGTTPRRTGAEAIAQAALEGDSVCGEVIEMMTAALGSAAGDLALATGARGGLYLGGGLIPLLSDAFDWGLFCRRFTAKGRFRDYLESIPVHAMTHPAPALYGLSVYLTHSRM
ncbi:glucokinase [Spiribacter vilamensis]|uniref:Glucokinase n=1 Tax=Spiribacter vilamensis TaxID=531306 RepID=A0A4Q8D0B2_9GAMM|nr:glucokinase [Spiribacter vilamensis]RZU98657.1 glucokinase [Spiribacter vilamensis]TVO60086.1 glucokinase [Spiribacter vilamensis]